MALRKHSMRRSQGLLGSFQLLTLHHGPVFTASRLVARLRLESHVQNPKGGELFVGKLKPEEILVEDWSDTDVQIVRLTCV